MSGWFFIIIIIIIIIIIVAHEIGPGFSVPVRSASRRWVCGSLRGQMLFAEALFFSFSFSFPFPFLVSSCKIPVREIKYL